MVAVDGDGDGAGERNEPTVPALHDGRPSPATRQRWRGLWAVGAVALALRWWMPGETITTTDEVNWQLRSKAFGEAIRSGDLAAASPAPTGQAATRPGITTMWTGELARVLVDPVDRVWSALGLGAGPSWLRIAHVLVALWCTAGLVALVAVARHLVGARAALVAGGLLAVEPLLVGHSAILHTDALVTTYAALGVLCLAAALEVGPRGAGTDPVRPGPPAETVAPDARAGPVPRHARWREPSVRLAALGGAAGAVAVLTKLNAVVLVGVACGVLAVAHLARPRGDPPAARRRTGRHLGAFALALVVVTVVPWPSLWVDPAGQYRAIVRSGQLAAEWSNRELFLGRVSRRVDRRFYAVAAWYRASAWLLVGSVAVAALTAVRVVRRRRSPTLPRRLIATLALPPLAYLAVLVTSAKHYDRYLLPVLPFAALGIGVVVAGLADRVGPSRRVGRLGWGALGAAALWTASLAPFAISHVDPLVGGQRAALTRLPLGWNEGVEHVFARNRAPDGTCTTVSTRRFTFGLPGCWAQTRWTFLDGSVPPPELILVYVGDRQRGYTTAEDAWVRQHAELVDSLAIDGVTYVELWRPRR